MQRGGGTNDEPQTPNNNRQNVSTFQKNHEVTLDLRKYILLLASLVATVTYAAGFSPPGASGRIRLPAATSPATPSSGTPTASGT